MSIVSIVQPAHICCHISMIPSLRRMQVTNTLFLAIRALLWLHMDAFLISTYCHKSRQHQYFLLHVLSCVTQMVTLTHITPLSDRTFLAISSCSKRHDLASSHCLNVPTCLHRLHIPYLAAFDCHDKFHHGGCLRSILRSIPRPTPASHVDIRTSTNLGN